MSLKLPKNLNLSITERDKKLLPYLGLLVFFFVFIFLIYLPTKSTIEEKTIELNEKTQQLNAENLEIKGMRNWQEKEKNKKTLTLAGFLDDVTKLANEEKLTIYSFSQGSVQADKNDDKDGKEAKKAEEQLDKTVGQAAIKIMPIELTIKLDGSYFAIESFLKKWDDSIKGVILTSISIDRIDDSDKLRLTLDAKAMF